MAYELTSLANLKVLVTSSLSDDALSTLIAHASQMIEKDLCTNVLARDYTEIQSGDGHKWLYVNNTPINKVYYVSAGNNTALTITYAGSAARASVTVTDTGVELRTTEAGVVTASTVLFTNAVSIDLMAAAINAITGWTAVVSSPWGGLESLDLLPTPAKSALNRQVELWVPGEEIEDVTISDCKSKLYNNAGWMIGDRNIRIRYNAGYAAVPPALESACIELVKVMTDVLSRNQSIQSESIGGYSYSLNNAIGTMFSGSVSSISNLVASKIQPFRRLMVWA